MHTYIHTYISKAVCMGIVDIRPKMCCVVIALISSSDMDRTKIVSEHTVEAYEAVLILLNTFERNLKTNWAAMVKKLGNFIKSSSLLNSGSHLGAQWA